MTCIAAMVDKTSGKVWMGADSLCVYSADIEYTDYSKIWLSEDSTWLVGCAGNMAYQQVLQNDVPFPAEPPEGDLCKYIRNKWLIPVREYVTKRKDLVDNEINVKGGSMLLVALQGRLFQVIGFDVYPARRDFCTIGSGAGEAYGVLHFIEEQKVVMKTEDKLRSAVAAAIARRNSVGGPCHILST